MKWLYIKEFKKACQGNESARWNSVSLVLSSLFWQAGCPFNRGTALSFSHFSLQKKRGLFREIKSSVWDEHEQNSRTGNWKSWWWWDRDKVDKKQVRKEREKKGTRHYLNDLFVDGSKQFPSLLTTCLLLKEIVSASLAAFCQAKRNQMRNYHATRSCGKTEKKGRNKAWLTGV